MTTLSLSYTVNSVACKNPGRLGLCWLQFNKTLKVYETQTLLTECRRRRRLLLTCTISNSSRRNAKLDRQKPCSGSNFVDVRQGPQQQPTAELAKPEMLTRRRCGVTSASAVERCCGVTPSRMNQLVSDASKSLTTDGFGFLFILINARPSSSTQPWAISMNGYSSPSSQVTTVDGRRRRRCMVMMADTICDLDVKEIELDDTRIAAEFLHF